MSYPQKKKRGKTFHFYEALLGLTALPSPKKPHVYKNNNNMSYKIKYIYIRSKK